MIKVLQDNFFTQNKQYSADEFKKITQIDLVQTWLIFEDPYELNEVLFQDKIVMIKNHNIPNLEKMSYEKSQEFIELLKKSAEHIYLEIKKNHGFNKEFLGIYKTKNLFHLYIIMVAFTFSLKDQNAFAREELFTDLIHELNKITQKMKAINE